MTHIDEIQQNIEKTKGAKAFINKSKKPDYYKYSLAFVYKTDENGRESEKTC